MTMTTIRHYGREFTVLATYPDTKEGRAQANAFMAANPGASLLCVVDGTAYIADSDDLGQPIPRHRVMVEAANTEAHISRKLIDMGWTPPGQQTSLALANAQHQLQVAIRHLHAILNQQRTATQSWQAEQEARQWLESIGSEAP